MSVAEQVVSNDLKNWRVAAEEPAPENTRTESIFAYYNPQAEVEKLQEILAKGGDRESIIRQMRHYYSENIIHFLNEYAKKTSHSEISFLLQDGRLNYANLVMSDEMEKTAQMTPLGSRERADLTGIKLIEQQISDYVNSTGRTDVLALKFSPAFIGDYSFLFAFRPKVLPDGKIEVRERILRYPEAKGSVNVSRHLYAGLTGNCEFSEPTQFLENPLIYSDIDPELNIDAVSAVLGIEEEKIAEARAFEDTVRTDLSGWIGRYCDKLIEISRFSTGSPDFVEGVAELKIILSAIYNRAQDIAAIPTDQKASNNQVQQSVMKSDIDKQIYLAYMERQAYVIGGGSCPVTGAASNIGSAGYWTVGDIYNSMTIGSLDFFFHNEQVKRCGVCGRSSEDNHYHCPGRDVDRPNWQCNKFYPDETNRPPEKRTKKCNCGFQFSC